MNCSCGEQLELLRALLPGANSMKAQDPQLKLISDAIEFIGEHCTDADRATLKGLLKSAPKCPQLDAMMDDFDKKLKRAGSIAERSPDPDFRRKYQEEHRWRVLLQDALENGYGIPGQHDEGAGPDVSH